jgi:methyl-accepting chemotaxis protein
MRGWSTWLLAGVVLLTAAAALLASVLAVQVARLSDTEQSKIDSVLLADELRQSSDDLTNLSRLYVQTGDQRYRDYFEEVLAIRSGESARPQGYEGVYWDFVLADPSYAVPDGEVKSLTDRMRELDFSDTEFNLLRSAQKRSDELAEIESDAFAAVQAGEPEIAAELVGNEEYFRAKAAIMEPIDRFLDSVVQRTSDEAASRLDNVRILINVLAGVSLVLLATVVTLVVVRMRS